MRADAEMPVAPTAPAAPTAPTASTAGEESFTVKIETYVELWHAAAKRCTEALERHDLRQIMQCPDAATAQAEIDKLRQASKLKKSSDWEHVSFELSIIQIYSFTSYLTQSLDSRIEMSVFWGMLFLVVKLSASTRNGLGRISRMIKEFGHKAELLNKYRRNGDDLIQIRDASLDVTVEVLGFFSQLVHFFRSANYDHLSDDSWLQITQQYKNTTIEIEKDIERIVQLAQILKSENRVDEVANLQELLHLSSMKRNLEEAKLPCYLLPPFKNTHFYDREALMDTIGAHFQPQTLRRGELRSYVLHGLGGVGKSTVALKYAYTILDKLDAVLWIYTQTEAAIAQSFTDAALRLQLPNAHPQHHEKNRILVLSWLQQTSAKWLTVFDNAEDADLLLQYWPIASTGLVLVTSRNFALAFEPADSGIEVPHFDDEEGCGFLLHLLSMDIASEFETGEAKSAIELSNRLSGHALAINQMAGLIHKRRWSIKEFVKIYDKNAKRLSGLPTSLGAVWRLSFDGLDAPQSAVLGVLSLVTPDTIPQELFEPVDPKVLPESLAFCTDQFEFSEVIETLLTLALIKIDSGARVLSLHRLVQEQFRYYISPSDQQESFAAAAKLLYAAFPQKPRDSHQMYNVWDRCQRYMQHVISLMRNYRNEASILRPTFEFCELLANFARYLLEVGTYPELAETLDIAFSAFKVWEERNDHLLVLADLYRHSATEQLHRGAFGVAEEQLQKAIDLYEPYGAENPKNFLAPYNIMGNITSSANRFNEGVVWYRKCEAINRINDPMVGVGLTVLNLGRGLWFAGETEEGLQRYAKAIELYRYSENWAMTAFAYYAIGNAYRKDQLLDQAWDNYKEANNIWNQNGQAPTFLFVAACLYKLGCVALSSGNHTKAIDYLRKAVTIAALRKSYIVGDYARALFKLSQALRKDPESQLEADEKRNEAERLLRTFPRGDDTELDAGDEQSYDNLICILWR